LLDAVVRPARGEERQLRSAYPPGVPSLLVTNDFPPKVGGIQSYLWELWRRLPPDEVTVLTTPYDGSAEFDRAQPFRVVRDNERVLLPLPALADRIDALARDIDAALIFLDPALPLGALGPRLRAAPYVAVLHGAEVTVPGRLPGSRALLRRVLDGAAGVLAAGTYPAEEAARAAGRPLPGLVIPPGVDVDRFRPQTDDGRPGVGQGPHALEEPGVGAPGGAAKPPETSLGARSAPNAGRSVTRKRFGLPEAAPLVLGVSRLVPRKGFDVLIDAVARLDRSSLEPVHLALAGRGRDSGRLARRAARAGLGERFHLLGRVADEDLPSLYATADVFAMCCRERWGGLEAEGFGIVFLEAAASGVPAVAGNSGGAWEAVDDGSTGFVVDPLDAGAVAAPLERLLADPTLRRSMGAAARTRAEQHFAYDTLAARLVPLARGDLSVLRPVGFSAAGNPDGAGRRRLSP
jgi:phosphatidylinositol alpha-1,6-mannosyltransferase